MKHTVFLFVLLLITVSQAQSNDSRFIRTQIEGGFEGWDGETVFKMKNGQVWQQYNRQDRFNYQSYNQEVLLYKKDCSWIMNLQGLNQSIEVIQIDKSYIANQHNLQKQIKGGYIYAVVRGSWVQRLIVKKGDYFYLMNILNGECCTMGTMKFDTANYDYQNVVVKQWPNSLGIGFKMKIIEKSRDYSLLEKKITL